MRGMLAPIRGRRLSQWLSRALGLSLALFYGHAHLVGCCGPGSLEPAVTWDCDADGVCPVCEALLNSTARPTDVVNVPQVVAAPMRCVEPRIPLPQPTPPTSSQPRAPPPPIAASA